MQAYRKLSGEPFPCWPESACAEGGGDLSPKYFEHPAVLGQFRAIFEPHWDAAVDAVGKRKLTATDKFVIAGYWANLLTATPAWRKIGQQLYEKEVRTILPIIEKQLPRPDSLKGVNLKVEVDEDIKAVVTKQLLPGALSLYHQQWTILTNDTAHEFLTSDNPSASFSTVCSRRHGCLANSIRSISVGSSASALELLTRFDTGHRAAAPYTLILAAIR